MKRIIYKYFHKLINICVFFYNLFHFKRNKNIKKIIYSNVRDQNFKQAKLFYKVFLNCRFNESYFKDFIDGYYNSEFKVYKKSNFVIESPILICVIKNEINTIPTFLSHYKSLNFKNIVFIDNNSSDGTLEYLASKDLTIFSIKQPFKTARKVGWINRIMDELGKENWFFIVDSDEYAYFEGMNIELLNKNNKKKKTIGAFLIDMYENENGEMKLFDNNFYSEYHRDFKAIYGGMRERVFKCKPLLKKHPYFYYNSKTVMINCHYLFPYSKNFDSIIKIAFLHYKNYKKDIEKIKKIVENGSYSNGSEEYKKYLEYLMTNENIPSCSLTECINNNEKIFSIIRKVKKL